MAKGNAFLTGIDYFVPPHRLTNEMLNSMPLDLDFDRLQEKTGITSRSRAEPNDTSFELGLKAARKLLTSSIVPKKSISGVIFVTQTPKYHMPSSSCMIQSELGLETDVFCFDVGQGCSGFIYGLWLAASIVSNTSDDTTVLLICSDKYSSIIDDDDRTSLPIFGDGASAALISNNSSRKLASIRAAKFGTDGSGYDSIITKINKESNRPIFQMNGNSVFLFTSSTIAKFVQNYLSENNLSVDQIDLFVFHQASKLVIDTLQRQLDLDPGKVVRNYEVHGNLVSSSIPVALCQEVTFTQEMRIMLVGFGVGLSWGCTILETRAQA